MGQEDDAAAVPQEVRAVPLEAEGPHRPPGLAGVVRDGVVHVRRGRAEGRQQLAALQPRHVGFGVERDAGLLPDVRQFLPGLAAVFPGGVACIGRGLAVNVAGFMAEDPAAGLEWERVSRRLAGGYSGPVHLDDLAAARKAWAIRTGGLLDDYHTRHVFWQQAGHGRHEDILAEIVPAERRAGRILKRRWVAFLKLAHTLSRRPCGRMSAGRVRKIIGRLRSRKDNSVAPRQPPDRHWRLAAPAHSYTRPRPAVLNLSGLSPASSLEFVCKVRGSAGPTRQPDSVGEALLRRAYNALRRSGFAMSQVEHPTEVRDSPAITSELVETYVAGIMHDGRHAIVPRLALREQVRLRRQPDNLADSNAILIERRGGEPLGFLPRELAAQIAPRMDSTCQQDGLEATVTELVSDAVGANFLVRICFELPNEWLRSGPSAPSPELEYQYEDNGTVIYVLLNSSEPVFNEIKKRLEANGFSCLRSGLCYRPAGNGRQYQWYLKIDQTDGAIQDNIERLFREHYGVASDKERARQLDESRRQYEARIGELQGQLAETIRQAKDYEEFAGTVDAENRQAIDRLQVYVKYLQGQIATLGDEKRQVQNKLESLGAALEHRPVERDSRYDDIADSVSNALMDIVGDCLPLTRMLDLIGAIFPKRVAIMNRAYKSAAASEGFRYKKKAFSLLWKLATEYWSMLASGRRDVNPHNVFGEAYSPMNPEQLDKKTRRLLTFDHNGKRIETMKHLRIGVRESPSVTLRIYFEWDAESRSIVIGHCGEHL
jgi:hypothetical protein